jgi:hypothetical protein
VTYWIKAEAKYNIGNSPLPFGGTIFVIEHSRMTLGQSRLTFGSSRLAFERPKAALGYS